MQPPSKPTLDKRGKQLLEEVRKAYIFDMLNTIGNSEEGDPLPVGNPSLRILHRVLESIAEIDAGTSLSAPNRDLIDQKDLKTVKNRILAFKVLTYWDTHWSVEGVAWFKLLRSRIEDAIISWDSYLAEEYWDDVIRDYTGQIMQTFDKNRLYRFFLICDSNSAYRLLFALPGLIEDLPKICESYKDDPVVQWIMSDGDFPYPHCNMFEIPQHTNAIIAYFNEHSEFPKMLKELVMKYKDRESKMMETINIYSVARLACDPILFEDDMSW